MIPYGHQDISEEDIQAVVDVLRSDWLTQGPKIDEFEHALADYCGAKYAVAVSNATAALHLGALALDLGPGEWLWTSPNTFVASANCGLYCGAQVDFVDIDPNTWNINLDLLEKKLISAKKTGKLPKVVVAVHFAGMPIDMQYLQKLAHEYGFKVIEDASHAVGGSFHGKKIGCSEYSDLTVFSFHPVKIITTGEGGLILTNQKDLYEQLKILRTHGITRDPARMAQVPDGPWYHEQIELGFNYRMTDIHAALGLSQLKRLDQFVDKRRTLVKRYQEQLKGLPLTWQAEPPGCVSAYHLFVVLLKNQNHIQKHRKIFEFLQKREIGVNIHYIPVYRQPYYQKFDFSKDDFPQAEAYYQSTLTLPLFPTLTFDQQDQVVSALRDVLNTNINEF